MLQLKNTSPFPAQIAILPDAQGIDTAYVSVKATFTLGSTLAIADPQVPIRAADEFHGEPGQSSLKYAGEVHLSKPATDVALVGSAWANGDRKAARVDVSLAIGPRKKVVRVFGDREWRPGFWFLPARMTAPQPFERMPLVYERAFGGVHETEGRKREVLFEPRNPVGRGFAGKRRGGALKGLPVPNLEDPSEPIRGPGDLRPPAGFGFVAPSWEPRKSFAGTYDAKWQKGRAPYLPADFDSRFFNAAHPDLIAPGYLEGGEPVEVVNASADGPLRFRLPRAELSCAVTIAGRPEVVPLRLETVLIEPDDSRLSMLWRGGLSCDKRALKVEEIAIGLGRLEMNGGSR